MENTRKIYSYDFLVLYYITKQNKIKQMRDLSHWGDVLAIPGFALLIYYFSQIPDKNELEYILYIFVTGAFLADILFTYWFVLSRKI